MFAGLVGAITIPGVLAQDPAPTDPQVRITARKLNNGRIEFALQQTKTDGSWSDRLLPQNRYFPPDTPTGRWLISTPLTLSILAPQPTLTPQSNPTTALALGSNHGCQVRTDNTITCWGNNEYGKANPPDGKYTAVAAHSNYTCGLRTDNIITCWGRYKDYYSGGFRYRSTEGYKYYKNAFAPEGKYTALAAGWSHACGLRTDGTITCWGYSSDGQTNAPHGEFTAITGGEYHACGLRTDGTITCWGSNEYGETNAPHGEFTALAAGGNQSCGLRTDYTLTCWGAGQ
ncbi:RCC1 domain-containing protein [Candidatus Poriferisocius sp.]|uniref:RCC1 domain-containing protein n=1 Tax=Candidatus Poriferisocius sp. TaxID=3101276 RepID=UPI003B01B3D0